MYKMSNETQESGMSTKHGVNKPLNNANCNIIVSNTMCAVVQAKMWEFRAKKYLD